MGDLTLWRMFIGLDRNWNYLFIVLNIVTYHGMLRDCMLYMSSVNDLCIATMLLQFDVKPLLEIEYRLPFVFARLLGSSHWYWYFMIFSLCNDLVRLLASLLSVWHPQGYFICWTQGSHVQPHQKDFKCCTFNDSNIWWVLQKLASNPNNTLMTFQFRIWTYWKVKMVEPVLVGEDDVRFRSWIIALVSIFFCHNLFKYSYSQHIPSMKNYHWWNHN